MNCNLPKITYPRFRLLLLLKFHEAICPEVDVAVTKRSIDLAIKPAYHEISRFLKAQDSLKQVKKSTSVACYRSSIALKLAAQAQQDVTEIARKLVDFYGNTQADWQKEDTGLIAVILSDLTVKPIAGGFLELAFGDRAIAAWLNGLGLLPDLETLQNCDRDNFTNNSYSKIVQDGQDNIFLCQYAYARCGALLRMASELSEFKSVFESRQFSWLSESGVLVGNERDRFLMAQIVTTLDESVTATAQDCLKLAVSLSQAFQEFYRESLIFGEIRVKNLQLGQCRLGLVMITHWILRSLLQEGLGVVAPDML